MIQKPIKQNNNNNINHTVSNILKEDYINWYNNVFEKFYLFGSMYKRSNKSNRNKKRTKNTNRTKKINNSTLTLNKKVSLNKYFKNKNIFEIIILYILYKRVTSINKLRKFYKSDNQQKRITLYKNLHKELVDDRKEFFNILTERYANNQGITTNYENVNLDIANGTIILVYKRENNIIVKLLFHGFPDKYDRNFLDYDYKINLSSFGETYFNSLLKENQGLIFVRHEHGFHNGLYKNKMVYDSPLTSLGIFKSILINRFLNKDIFELPFINDDDPKNIFDLINIKQMIVSPLIRTHMTGILIFNNSYIIKMLKVDDLSDGNNLNIEEEKNGVEEEKSENHTSTTHSLSSQNSSDLYPNSNYEGGDGLFNNKKNKINLFSNIKLIFNFVENMIKYYNENNINNSLKNISHNAINYINNSLKTDKTKKNKLNYKFMNVKKTIKKNKNNANRQYKSKEDRLNKQIFNKLKKKINRETNFSYREITNDELRIIIKNKTKIIDTKILNSNNIEEITEYIFRWLSDQITFKRYEVHEEIMKLEHQ